MIRIVFLLDWLPATINIEPSDFICISKKEWIHASLYGTSGVLVLVKENRLKFQILDEAVCIPICTNALVGDTYLFSLTMSKIVMQP